MTRTTPAWVAVDWGVLNLCVWVIGPEGAVIARLDSDHGAASLNASEFEPVLLELIADHLPKDGKMPVIVSGPAGARHGWCEVPCAAAPCLPPGLADAARPRMSDPRLDVRILPGVQQQQPPDMMRGAETLISGFLSREPEFDGVLCLTGAHTMWAHISAREIVSFQTFITGELFDLLSKQSTLRPAVESGNRDEDAFGEAVTDAMSSPHFLTSRLFGLKALHDAGDTAALASCARLWGMLIGIELAGARNYWLGRDIVIIGAPEPTQRYHAALKLVGAPARQLPADDLALAGLMSAYADHEA